MRSIRHPGPPQLATEAVPARLKPFEASLAPGLNLLDAVQAAFDAQGATSGVAQIRGGHWSAWPYVMPALSRSAAHAVYFSERHETAAPVRLQAATLTYGQRAGQPWLHAHADWTDAAGQALCGHVLPHEARLADGGCVLQAWALQGAGFEVQPDAETNFSLFRPAARPAEGDAAPHDALALRLSPHQDLCTALEDLCRAQGWAAAVLRGGVGSTVGAAFADGSVVHPFVTELYVTEGRVEPDAACEPRAVIDIRLVDHLGGRHGGRLARGENPVLVTFEGVLQRVDTR